MTRPPALRYDSRMADSRDGFVVVPAFASRAVDSIGSGDAFFAISSLAARLDAPLEITAFLGNVAGALAVQIIGNQKAIDKPGLTKYVTSLLK